MVQLLGAGQAEMTLNPESLAANSADRRGLECPKCGCKHFIVIYTRGAAGGKLIRRRECRHCGRRTILSEVITSSSQEES